jgi:hypothetical protein
LREALTVGGEIDHVVGRAVLVLESFEAAHQRAGLEHHPPPTPEGIVVDLVLWVLGRVAQVMHAHRGGVLFERAAQHAAFQRPAHDLRQRGDEIDGHCK